MYVFIDNIYILHKVVNENYFNTGTHVQHKEKKSKDVFSTTSP